MICGLRYDAESGFVVVELADGRELLVSACWEGCHVLLDDSCERNGPVPPFLRR